MKHRGEIVRQRIDQQGVKMGVIAKNLGTDRSTLYRWLDQANMDVNKVEQIGKVIKWDFREDFPDIMQTEPAHLAAEPDQVVYSPASPMVRMAERLVREAHDEYIRCLAELNRAVVMDSLTTRK
jgi:transposase-like protein